MSGLGLSPVDLYVTYAGSEPTRAAASLQSNAQASAQLAYFKKAAPGITTAAGLLGDYKALTVVLTAFGLQGAIKNTALLRKLLTQDPTASTSLAKTLGNAKYAVFAQAFGGFATPPFATAANVAQIASSYTTNVFEQSADAQSPGLANALAFTRQASSLTTISAVQTDPNLLAVVVATLGLPLADFQQLGFDQQTAILTKQFKVANLQDPSYVKRAAEQYLVLQQSTTDSGPAAGSVASLFSDSSNTGDDLLSILDPSSNLSGGSAGDSALSLFA